MILLPVKPHYSDKVSIRRAVLLAQKRVKFVRADLPHLFYAHSASDSNAGIVRTGA